jgi:hypothetical protein
MATGSTGWWEAVASLPFRRQKSYIAIQEDTMKNMDIKGLLYNHLLSTYSVILSIFIPSFFLENISILETHSVWLCICSVFVNVEDNAV